MHVGHGMSLLFVKQGGDFLEKFRTLGGRFVMQPFLYFEISLKCFNPVDLRAHVAQQKGRSTSLDVKLPCRPRMGTME
jgi:hypothetical protein